MSEAITKLQERIEKGIEILNNNENVENYLNIKVIDYINQNKLYGVK